MSNFPKSNLVKKLLFEEFGGGRGREGGEKREGAHNKSGCFGIVFYFYDCSKNLCKSHRGIAMIKSLGKILLWNS